MKRFFMCLVATLMATMTFASDYDTIFVKPGDNLDIKLIPHYDKHPALVGQELTWYLGCKDFAVAEIADSIASIIKPITLLGEKVWHVEKASKLDSGFVFTGYKLSTKAASTAVKDSMSKEDITGMTTDTIAFVHVLSKLDNTSLIVNPFSLNGDEAANVSNQVGDTIKVSISATNPINVQTYSLVKCEANGDTTILVSSTKPSFEFITENSINGVQAMITNDLGSYIFADKKINITVKPSFKVVALTSSVVTMKDIVTKTVEDTNVMDVNVLNHDSVALIITTNRNLTNITTKTSWNKDGVGLPEGTIANDTILTFSEFLKKDMEGRYNCLIYNNTIGDVNIGKLLETVTFVILAQYPTSNEGIEGDITPMFVADGILYLNEVNGVVRVFGINGSLLKTFKVNGGTERITLNLPKGTYIISNEENNIKVSI